MNKDSQCPCRAPYSRIRYEEKYDAYFCLDCDKWLEKKCENEECSSCKDRPEKPSQVREGSYNFITMGYKE